MYLSANRIIDIVCEAITERHILAVRYQHTDNQMIVLHRLAPFDVGTTNPKNIQRFADNLYAYSYTHIDRETNLPDPRVITFNIHYFIDIITTEEIFDETDLCLRNLRATKYDYRNCRFALLPNRNWFVTI